jgi:predicted porin
MAIDLEADLYGELNLSRDHVQSAGSDWVSNVSKIGVKGSHPLTADIDVVFQVEQEVDIAHGGTNIDDLLSTRNTFIGIKGSFGKLLFGTHDTPVKKVQGKIDLFNDQLGDIKGLVSGEVRARDVLGYHSNSYDGFSLQAMYVPSDGNFDASKSIAIMYSADDLYASLGYDADMRKNERTVARTRVYDTIRGVVQYTPGDWKFGLLLQGSKQVNGTNNNESAYIVSASRRLGRFTVNGQWGQSDILANDASRGLLGLDFKLNDATRLYGIFSAYEQAGTDVTAVSVGAEYKF